MFLVTFGNTYSFFMPTKETSVGILQIVPSVHPKKTDKWNLLKLHRKIKQTEKECHAQNLGSHDIG